MECCRDEALRVKEIAERKFLSKDIKGAKKFALKAQKINPELEGISQMLMTLEVYISAEDEKLHGESNWYGVLGVTPLADNETIRKQYRKIARVLHPDKNRSIGAEGAFQLVSQAWSLLSDKLKRVAYDQRLHRYQTTRKEGPPQNELHNSANTAAHKGSVDKKNPTSVPIARKKESHTFWTVCHRCKMQYEYVRMYLNHNLLCPNCQEAYFAVEIDPPSTKISKASSHSRSSQQQHRSETTRVKYAAQASNMVQQAYEKVKREKQKAQAAARKEDALRRKIISSKRPAESSGHADFAKKMKGVELRTLCRDGLQKCKSKCRVDMKCSLMEKARDEIHKKLSEPVSAITVKNVVETVEDVKGGSSTRGAMSGQIKECELEEKVSQLVTVDVSTPDFHDFDDDRTELCFSENQVWAVYDDRDGMPRHYAMIQSIISIDPFEVKLSWLSSITHSRLGHVNWFSSGFSKTCGEFRTGRVEICNSVECFSHVVKCTKYSSKKNIRIFPRKGHVWALYRNWSAEWNELTEDEVIHKYDIIEVLEDYDEEFGVLVIPLFKVAGFKSVFHPSLNPNEIKRISKEEMSRFSHQVPCHLLSGKEGSKPQLKGCRELDPAAIPLEIVQAMSKIEEIEFIESDDEIIEFVSAVYSEGNNVAGVP